jgi:hypothetical protein
MFVLGEVIPESNQGMAMSVRFTFLQIFLGLQANVFSVIPQEAARPPGCLNK